MENNNTDILKNNLDLTTVDVFKPDKAINSMKLKSNPSPQITYILFLTET